MSEPAKNFLPQENNKLLSSSISIWTNILFDLSLVVRKPVFGVSDQVRHKPGVGLGGGGQGCRVDVNREVKFL